MSIRRVQTTFTGILFAAFLLAGCESAQVPLGEPDELLVDASVLGEWVSEGEDGDPSTLSIWAFNDHEYYVEWLAEYNDPDLVRLRIFSSDLGGELFSNIQCVDCSAEDRNEWMFYWYEMESPDVLLVKGIANKHYRDSMAQMTRSRDVRRYVEQHMHDEGFFSEEVARFTRVQPESTD